MSRRTHSTKQKKMCPDRRECTTNLVVACQPGNRLEEKKRSKGVIEKKEEAEKTKK